jgi:hypothetical protein
MRGTNQATMQIFSDETSQQTIVEHPGIGHMYTHLLVLNVVVNDECSISHGLFSQLYCMQVTLF